MRSGQFLQRLTHEALKGPVGICFLLLAHLLLSRDCDAHFAQLDPVAANPLLDYVASTFFL